MTPNTHNEGPEEAIRSAQGKMFVHVASGGLYRVQGHLWDAERNRWMLIYARLINGGKPGMINDPDSPRYAHLPEDFFRAGRFLEVKA